jgi:hypothetical protein
MSMKWFLASVMVVALAAGSFEAGRQVQARSVPVIETVQPIQRYELADRGQIIRIADPVVPVATTEAPATQSILMAWVTNVLTVLAVPLAALVSALLLQIVALVAKKYHLQVSDQVQQHLYDTAETAVHKAEAWAASKKDVPTSSEKMNFALKSFRNIAELPAVKKYTDEQLSHYVEEAVFHLFNKDAPATDAAPTNPV